MSLSLMLEMLPMVDDGLPKWIELYTLNMYSFLSVITTWLFKNSFMRQPYKT